MKALYTGKLALNTIGKEIYIPIAAARFFGFFKTPQKSFS